MSIAFIICMCVLVVAGKGDEKSSSNDNNDKQSEIHIHNITDSVSENMVKEELAQLRNELERKQRLDMEVLEKLDELINK